MSGHVVVIAGAGPAGLMAAEVLSAAGVRVVVHYAMPSVGHTFLMAGRGGLNLAHAEPLPTFTRRHGKSADWLAHWHDRFAPDSLRGFAERQGQEAFAGCGGRVFPKAIKASPMPSAWRGDGLAHVRVRRTDMRIEAMFCVRRRKHQNRSKAIGGDAARLAATSGAPGSTVARLWKAF
jgi:predicted flavoprotein YhiN